MATNALARRWEFDVPNVNNLLQPIQQGIARADRLRQQDVENRRADEQMGMQREQFQFQQKRAAREDDAAKVARLGREATAIMSLQGAKRQSAWQSWINANPDVADHARRTGVDLTDYMAGPQFIATQAGAYDPNAAAKSQAEIARLNAAAGLANAQAGYYRAKSVPAPSAPATPTDPASAGYGLDENDNIVGPGVGGPSRPAQPDFTGLPPPDMSRLPSPTMDGVSVVRPNLSPLPRPLPEPMRLGGPRDEWIDMGGGVSIAKPSNAGNVQLAQAGGPSIVDVARQRAFGPAGITSPSVEGIVTDAGRNRRTDVPATREMQGQRAIDTATPEQRDRLMRFRNTQQMWAYTYGRQPRAGYYYGEDGRELPLTDKNYKGDREAQAVALMNMNKVEAASKKLLDYNWLSRTLLGAGNVGEVGQAFADMKQGALGIAYALSGKTVAVAEMKNFIEAYGPVPGDGADRIQQKTQRMREFYQALLTASRGGESYETAFARAMAATGLKNPDGSPAGAPAAASGGAPRPQAQPVGAGVRGMTTDELIRSLNGGR